MVRKLRNWQLSFLYSHMFYVIYTLIDVLKIIFRFSDQCCVGPNVTDTYRWTTKSDVSGGSLIDPCTQLHRRTPRERVTPTTEMLVYPVTSPDYLRRREGRTKWTVPIVLDFVDCLWAPTYQLNFQFLFRPSPNSSLILEEVGSRYVRDVSKGTCVRNFIL